MIKACVVCGGEFEARGTCNTCSLRCKNDRTKARRRARYIADPEHHRKQVRESYQKCADKRRASSRNWYYANKEKALVKAAKYREKNKEQIRESQKRYRVNNREKVLESDRKKNARISAERRALKIIEAQLAQLEIEGVLS